MLAARAESATTALIHQSEHFQALCCQRDMASMTFRLASAVDSPSARFRHVDVGPKGLHDLTAVQGTIGAQIRSEKVPRRPARRAGAVNLTGNPVMQRPNKTEGFVHRHRCAGASPTKLSHL